MCYIYSIKKTFKQKLRLVKFISLIEMCNHNHISLFLYYSKDVDGDWLRALLLDGGDTSKIMDTDDIKFLI